MEWDISWSPKFLRRDEQSMTKLSPTRVSPKHFHVMLGSTACYQTICTYQTTICTYVVGAPFIVFSITKCSGLSNATSFTYCRIIIFPSENWMGCLYIMHKVYRFQRGLAMESYKGHFTPEPNIFLWICTHTQTITINNDLCPPMLFKLRPCIQKLCNVYYLPTPSLGWIGQIKSHSLSLASTWSVSWLVYSLHPRSLSVIWSWMQGCTKTMPTHEQ